MDSTPRRALGLLLALALYFGLRALILASNFDEVAMPQYELFPMGTIPLLLGVDGGLPIARLYDNAAGQILVGMLAVPSYALFGSSYLALKLVPLLLGAATLVLVWKSVDELADRRAADASALLFALAPTTLTKYSLMASGNHFETLAFTALALGCWVRVQRRGASPLRLAVFGAACGFALFVFLGALTPIALLLLAHFGLRGLRASLRDAPWLGAGFAVGLAPLVGLNLATGARGLEFLDAKFGASSTPFDGAVALERLGAFLFEHLPAATQFRDLGFVPASVARWAFFAVFALAYVALLPLAVRTFRDLLRRWLTRAPAPSGLEPAGALALLACAYLPLTALAFSISSLKIEPKLPPMDAEGYRYFNTHFLFATVVIALAGWTLRERASRAASVVGSVAGRALVGVALLCGGFNFALVDWSFERPNVGAYYDGFKLRQVATQLLTPRNGYSHEQIVAMIESYPREYRPWLYQGVGRALAAKRFLASRDGELELWSLLDAFPAARRGDVARGFGTFFRHIGRVRSKLDARFLALASERLAANDPLAPAALEGLALDWEIPMAWDLERDMNEMELFFLTLPHELRKPYSRGFGAACGRKLRRGLPYDVELVRDASTRVPLEYRTPFSEGVGAGLVEGVRPARGGYDPVQVLGELADLDALERGRAQRRAELDA
jgi:hypothetical protein